MKKGVGTIQTLCGLPGKPEGQSATGTDCFFYSGKRKNSKTSKDDFREPNNVPLSVLERLSLRDSLASNLSIPSPTINFDRFTMTRPFLRPYQNRRVTSRSSTPVRSNKNEQPPKFNLQAPERPLDKPRIIAKKIFAECFTSKSNRKVNYFFAC